MDKTTAQYCSEYVAELYYDKSGPLNYLGYEINKWIQINSSPSFKSEVSTLSQQQEKNTNSKFEVFVRNLPYTISSKDLAEKFMIFGNIKTAYIETSTFRGVEVSRGFGYVTFENADSMNKAFSQSWNIDIDGRHLIISQTKSIPHDILFIRNIPMGTTQEDAMRVFAPYQPVRAKIIKFNDKKIVGFIQFVDEEHAKNTVKIQPHLLLNGVQLIIKLARRPYNLAPVWRKRTPRRFRAPREFKQILCE